MHPNKQFETAFCRWRCPLCEATTVGVRIDPRCQSTSNKLRTHIRATSDPAHGPQGEYPSTVDPADLDAYVSCTR